MFIRSPVLDTAARLHQLQLCCDLAPSTIKNALQIDHRSVAWRHATFDVSVRMHTAESAVSHVPRMCMMAVVMESCQHLPISSVTSLAIFASAAILSL